MSAKREALLAQKENILNEIRYYEKRIEEARTTIKKSSFYEDDDSSDEADLVLLDNGPSLGELKQEHEMLKTCLHATQELTSLEVLQSEVNVLVDGPPLDGSSPAKEDGVWKEVVAECCLDLVPFAITFYTFKANRSFAPIEYENLKVTAIKKAHDVELSKSVLPGLTRPSDAIEVIRSYALAHRSRRTTLARLANKFSSSLILEPIPEGGYLMKCANLLEVSWTLQNKWSPIAPFHHRMKFDLEYMDEAYIKTITQAHRQLSEPDVDTDERTLLLAKIITTCLQAQGPTQELHDSISSDPETLASRRTNLDREPEEPSVKRAKKDSEVMAPPKGVPKKVKKGNVNVDSNKKPTKRSIEHNENADNPKRAKSMENNSNKYINNGEKTSNEEHNVATSKNSSEKTSAVSKSDSIKKKSTEKIVNDKETTKKVNENHVAEDNNTEKSTSDKKVKKSVHNTAKTVAKVSKISDKTEKPNKNDGKCNEEISKATETTVKSTDKVLKSQNKEESTKASETKTSSTEKTSKKPQSGEKNIKDKGTHKVVKKAVSKSSENIPKSDNTTNHNVKGNKNAAEADNATKNNVKSNTNCNEPTVTKANKDNNVASDKNKTSKNVVAGNTVGKSTKKIVSNEKNAKKPDTDNNFNKVTRNNVEKFKNIASAPNIGAKGTEKINKVNKPISGKSSVASANKKADVASAEKNLNKNPTQTKVPKVINAEKPKNSVPKIGIIPNKTKATIPSKKIITSNTKTLSSGISGKENAQNNLKVSKIPLKKLSSENSSKLTLRVSPRQPLKTKVLSKFGSETKVKSK